MKESTPYPRFISTRGAEAVSFREALLAGLAPDGGLYVPDRIPHVGYEVWKTGARLADVGTAVLARWLGAEVPEQALRPIMEAALDFPVPLVPLSGKGWEGLHVLELFHGPTLSFKDFGARTMARLMDYFLQGQQAHRTVLVATSGDTGSAVADGFAGQANIRVVLLYPQGQVSPVQERQLITARPGVCAFAVEGTFDDCQRLVKEAFAAPHLAPLRLSSANSINIGRLLPQMLYYGWAARQQGTVVFCVPSGNLGNLTGGALAALSGLPVQGFIAAHNVNDFFPRHLQVGASGFVPSVRTHSSAMDVGVPSNFERLRHLLSADKMRAWIWGTSVTDAATLDAMRRVYEATGYLADPHTAVGLEAARRYRAEQGRAVPIVVLSTAHPAKFPEVVREALGFEPEMPQRLAALWRRDTRVAPLPPTPGAFEEKLLAYARA